MKVAAFPQDSLMEATQVNRSRKNLQRPRRLGRWKQRLHYKEVPHWKKVMVTIDEEPEEIEDSIVPMSQRPQDDSIGLPTENQQEDDSSMVTICLETEELGDTRSTQNAVNVEEGNSEQRSIVSGFENTNDNKSVNQVNTTTGDDGGVSAVASTPTQVANQDSTYNDGDGSHIQSAKHEGAPKTGGGKSSRNRGR